MAAILRLATQNKRKRPREK